MPISETASNQAIQSVVTRIQETTDVSELSLGPRVDLARQFLLTELPDTTAAELADDELAAMAHEVANRLLSSRKVQ